MANKATFKNMADSAEGVANRAMEQGREAAEGTQEVAGNIKSVVDKSVRINRWPRSLWPLPWGSCSPRSERPNHRARRTAMFRAIFAKVKAEANSFWGKYLARVFVAVPFLVALGFATVATTMMLVEQFGQLNAYLILAASFTLVGLTALALVRDEAGPGLSYRHREQAFGTFIIGALVLAPAIYLIFGQPKPAISSPHVVAAIALY